jgi:hypothetical protein
MLLDFLKYKSIYIYIITIWNAVYHVCVYIYEFDLYLILFIGFG